jgi:hypothetical protein
MPRPLPAIPPNSRQHRRHTLQHEGRWPGPGSAARGAWARCRQARCRPVQAERAVLWWMPRSGARPRGSLQVHAREGIRCVVRRAAPRRFYSHSPRWGVRHIQRSLAGCGASADHHAPVGINPDTSGNLIQGHSGSILKLSGTIACVRAIVCLPACGDGSASRTSLLYSAPAS